MIRGLKLIENFITREQEIDLVNYLDSKVWNTNLKRRTQHYGYEYNYSSKNISTKIESIPNIIIETLSSKFNFNDNTQCIVNEYFPGQGISFHIDSIKLFDNKIISLSLNSGISMHFKKSDYIEELYLPKRSLLILEDEARYEWQHGILNKKIDYVMEDDIRKIEKRERRISITVRELL